MFDVSLGVVALVVAGLYALFAIVRSRSMISGLTHAQPVGPDELRPLRRLVENVVDRRGPCRSLRSSASSTTTRRTRSPPGSARRTSYVGVTTGLLRAMPKRELEAVLAHEISHIRNRDTYLMTMATVFAGVIALVADVGFRTLAYGGRQPTCRRSGRRSSRSSGFVLAPYAALLLRMSLSRRREFLADAGAAEILSDPEAMALALRRLELDTTTVRYADASTAHLWVESPTTGSTPTVAACSSSRAGSTRTRRPARASRPWRSRADSAFRRRFHPIGRSRLSSASQRNETAMPKCAFSKARFGSIMEKP